MATLPRQDRLRASGDDIDDSLPAGPLLAQQTTLLGDLNAIRSQLRRLGGQAHWYEPPRLAGGGGGLLSPANKQMPCRVTSTDGDLASEIAVQRQPAPGAYIGAIISGWTVTSIGNGTRSDCVLYFSGDGGATARAWGEVQLYDTVHFNGSVAGQQLDTSDVLSLIFEESA